MEFILYTNEENLKKMVEGELFEAAVHVDDDFDIHFTVDGRHIRSVLERSDSSGVIHVTVLPDFVVPSYKIQPFSHMKEAVKEVPPNA